MDKRALAYGCLTQALWAFPLAVHSQTITVQFEVVNGRSCSAPAPATGEVLIAGDCGGYVIGNRGTNVAKVVTGTDANNDTLTLKDVKITRTGVVSGDLHISYYATPFTPLPSAVPPGPSVEYRISGTGTFKRTNNALQLATGSHIIANGNIQAPPGSTDRQIGSPPPSFIVIKSNAFSATQFAAQDVWPSLTEQRQLKGDIWIKLNHTTHSLEITAITVSNHLAARTQMGRKKAHRIMRPRSSFGPNGRSTQCTTYAVSLQEEKPC